MSLDYLDLDRWLDEGELTKHPEIPREETKAENNQRIKEDRNYILNQPHDH